MKVAEEFNGVREGMVFNGWTVISPPFRLKYKWMVVCECECSNRAGVYIHHLVNDKSKRCGCSRMESMATASRTHGGRHTPLYRVWKGMRERCTNPKNKRFDCYGGRGIKVCDSWMEDFAAFREWATANGWHKGLQIDRRDNEGDYCPDNCRITTNQVNSNNTRHNRYLTAFGETKSMADWSRDERCRVAYSTLKRRMRTGWKAEDALTLGHRLWG